MITILARGELTLQPTLTPLHILATLDFRHKDLLVVQVPDTSNSGFPLELRNLINLDNYVS